jgi:hypothetical protein
MKIQLNSDKTITVDASLKRFVDGEVSRFLGRFAKSLTRVEIHLSDVNSWKTGQADKRCLVEVRPAGSQPLSTSATAAKVASAVGAALGKMQRSLTTFFGRRGRSAAVASTPVRVAKKRPARSTTVATKKKVGVKKVAAKKAAAKKTTKLSPRGPKKKGIYQARRKSWPAMR